MWEAPTLLFGVVSRWQSVLEGASGRFHPRTRGWITGNSCLLLLDGNGGTRLSCFQALQLRSLWLAPLRRR
eukprot:scaffold776_cov347-Pavlova_lutheri.AAC.62